MQRSDAIKKFLEESTHADLAALYNRGMEVQVNVAQGDGERTEKEFDGHRYWVYSLPNGASWKPFRIPRNAYSEPEDNDTPITFPLANHAEAIGMTGWDWENRVSRWVGFDFDSVIGHSDAHECKLSAKEIADVQRKAGELEYVTVRQSTGGNGLHLYVFLEVPEPTANHNEHAALARAILNQMSFDTGFDFISSTDVCGGNLWVWARKMERSEDGLILIKQGGTLKRIPEQWRSNLGVIERKRSTGSVRIYDTDDEQDTYDQLGRNRPRMKLDDGHKALIKYLEEETDYTTWYEQDEQRLVTHTLALKQAHDALKLRGIFETDSTGSTEQNCFCYPLPKGGWTVRRYGTNVKERASWSKDPNGWTRCLFNMPPVISDVAGLLGGVETPQGGFEYPNLEALKEATRTLGIELDVTDLITKNKGWVTQQKDGRVKIEIDCEGLQDRVDMPGWSIQKKKWTKIIEAETSNEEASITLDEMDQFLRYVQTEEGSKYGFYYLPPTSKLWQSMTKDDIKDALYNRGYTKTEDIRNLVGAASNAPWTVISQPFSEEYPGNRMWNFKNVQLSYPLKSDPENLKYPTWMRILNHVGHNLTRYIEEDAWCKNAGITTGGEYLKLWCAWMFQYPQQRLPYLFFYSLQQHTGKTTFHEQLSKLMTKEGYVKAERSIDSNFNGELMSAILCAIEELDLTENRNAYNKVKDLVTAQIISIRDLHKAQIQIDNTTHWVQTANSLNFLPIEPYDTRIVVCLVHPLKDVMTTKELNDLCRKESTDFLTALFSMELPTPPPGRMGIPVIQTDEKARAEQAKESQLDAFIRENCFYVPGKAIHYKQFEDAFRSSLESPAERGVWSDKKIKREMPLEKYPRGKWGAEQTIHYGNLSLTPGPPDGDRLILAKGTLIKDKT